MNPIKLSEMYRDPERIVVTAHRGFSGKYPENTLLAFEKAIEEGADLIEFDLRGTKDHVPVVLHDPTIDRTSNGHGSPNQYTLDELKQFNFSHWIGPGHSGQRFEAPVYPDLTIPTFRELLELCKEKVGLNIQVYEVHSPLLENICRLYHEFDLYEDGYLSMSTYADAEAVRKLNSKIQLCVLEDQRKMDYASLQKQKSLGLNIIQPNRNEVTSEFCGWVRELSLWANMFYSNTDEDHRRYIGYGLQGILTDYVDILNQTLKDLGRRR